MLRIGWILIGVLLVVGIWLFLRDQTDRLSLEEIPVPVPDAPSLRLVHISDLHCKTFGEENQTLYRMIAEAKPDLICYTGDTANRHEPDSLRRQQELDDACAFLASLTEIAPTVVIFGNHDSQTNMQDYQRERLEPAGVVVLQNQSVSLSLRGETVSILGLCESDSDPESIRRMLAEFESAPGFRLLLSHYPENFALKDDSSYSRCDFHLMLAGHAHGGQFILPLVGSVYAPGQGLFPKYTNGLYRENGRTLVVSRGLGGRSFPFRLFNHPQVGLLLLQDAEPADRT